MKSKNGTERSKDSEKRVFDAKNMILGRLASVVAKELLSGKDVYIVNAESAVISGSKKVIKEKYKTRLDLQEKENPEHSPYWSRRPDMLVKRVVRGMLPYRMPRGKEAFRRLKVFMGVPEELKGVKPVDLNIKDPKSIYSGYITVAELSKLLGYDRFEKY